MNKLRWRRHRVGLGWVETFAAAFIAFGLGILAGTIIKRWEIRYSRPVISIISQVVVRYFKLTDEKGTAILFFANRVQVTNTGRTGAKDCKVYVDFGENIVERSGWMLPDDNAAYSLTLNVDVIEYVDLCGISADGLTRVLTLEYGYRRGTVKSCRILSPGIRDVTVRVTSSNAQPAAKMARQSIIFLMNMADQTKNRVKFVPHPTGPTTTPFPYMDLWILRKENFI